MHDQIHKTQHTDQKPIKKARKRLFVLKLPTIRGTQRQYD